MRPGDRAACGEAGQTDHSPEESACDSADVNVVLVDFKAVYRVNSSDSLSQNSCSDILNN